MIITPPARARRFRRTQLPWALAFILSLCLLTGAWPGFAQAPAAKRPLAAADVYRMLDVADPQVSPDGRWVAYTVTGADREADKLRTSIWMVDWEGKQEL